jgi:hypothetical protein
VLANSLNTGDVVLFNRSIADGGNPLRAALTAIGKCKSASTVCTPFVKYHTQFIDVALSSFPFYFYCFSLTVYYISLRFISSRHTCTGHRVGPLRRHRSIVLHSISLYFFVLHYFLLNVIRHRCAGHRMGPLRRHRAVSRRRPTLRFRTLMAVSKRLFHSLQTAVTCTVVRADERRCAYVHLQQSKHWLTSYTHVQRY